MPARGPEPRLSLPLPASVRHGYGFGAFALAIANTAVMFFLLKYLVDGAGLDPAAAGTVLLVGKVWDAVTDPLEGRLTDRTRTRFGARRPWLLAAAVPFAVLFAAIWWGLPWRGTGAVVGYALLLVAYNTVYSAVAVPYGALTPSLTSDYDERTRLNAARMGWSMTGGIVAGIGVPVLLAEGGWRLAGLGLAALIVPPILVTVWATRGRDHPVEDPQDAPIWGVLGLPAFRKVALLFVVAWGCIGVLGALVPFYVQHHLRHPELLDLTFAAIQLSALVAVPAVAWAAERSEKHLAYAVGMGTWAAVLLALALVPAGTGAPALVLAALVGPGVAAAHVLPWSMLPDVVEADRLATGHDRAGSFYGMMTFLEKCATAVALWLLGVGLSLAGYAEGASSQPESAQAAIRWLIGPVPGGVLVAAALWAWRSPPLTRAEHRALVERLRAGPTR